MEAGSFFLAGAVLGGAMSPSPDQLLTTVAGEAAPLLVAMAAAAAGGYYLARGKAAKATAGAECCSPTAGGGAGDSAVDQLNVVRKAYGALARDEDSCCGASRAVCVHWTHV